MAELPALTWLLGTIAFTSSTRSDIVTLAISLMPMVWMTVSVWIIPLGGQLSQPMVISAARMSACIFVIRFWVASLVRNDSSRKIVRPICTKYAVGVHADAPEAVGLVPNRYEG